jgi:uncharacterized membrane protein
MTDGKLHPRAEEYLIRLRRCAKHLPRDRRHELTSEIEGHLAEVAPLGAPEDEVLQALERLGPPGDIIEAERPSAAVVSDQRGTREWGAVILLPLGGFVFGIGWLVGLILLWSSRLWTTRDKLIGTFIIPGGIVTALFVMVVTASVTTSGGGCAGTSGPINAATGRPVGHATFHCSSTVAPSTVTTILQVALAVFLILGPFVSAIYLARRAGTASRRLAPADG